MALLAIWRILTFGPSIQVLHHSQGTALVASAKHERVLVVSDTPARTPLGHLHLGGAIARTAFVADHNEVTILGESCDTHQRNLG